MCPTKVKTMHILIHVDGSRGDQGPILAGPQGIRAPFSGSRNDQGPILGIQKEIWPDVGDPERNRAPFWVSINDQGHILEIYK